MSRKDIEARLDRSLQNQIAVPRLDRRFDAAVWARIEAAEAPAAATNPGVTPATARALRASRWLAVSNAVGIAVTLAVALYFVLRTFGGIEIPVGDVDVSVPAISEDMVARITGVLGQVLGLAALVFGLSFTSFGRRVRASFS
jgi:hypothetical protein